MSEGGRQMRVDAAPKSYCVFCRSGSERKAAREIMIRFPEVEAIAPVKIVREKRCGTWHERELPILPGYLFLYTQDQLPGRICARIDNLFRLLGEKDTTRELTGEDAGYAAWIRKHHGRIEPSRVTIAENREVRIIDGPLADINGIVKKLDRHKQRALIEFPFAGQKRTVSISVEFVEAVEQENQRVEKVS